MSQGHSPQKPPGQGDFGKVYTTPPKSSSNVQSKPASTPSPKGLRPPGVGGSK